jgi:hypothetical protein
MSAQTGFDNLVQLLRSSKDLPKVDKPVFWLGAGCSVFDGIPLNAELLKRVIGSSSSAWGSQQYRFDGLMYHTSPHARAFMLEPHFKCALKPDSPYRALVEILRRGYAEVVLTFNIDNLLDQALQKCTGLAASDFELYSAPQYKPAALISNILRPATDQRITVVKLHGDVQSGINLMTSHEIVEYEPGLGEVCAKLSERPAVVCGYSFLHLNVLLKFSRSPSPLFYVAPDFTESPMVLSLMSVRNKLAPHFIDGNLGRFEQIMPALLARLP